jgi:hypothetical protein
MTAQTYHDDLNVYGVNSGGAAPRSKKVTLTFEESLTSGFSEPVGAVGTPGGHVYIANRGSANVVVLAYTSSNFGIVKTLDDSGEFPYDVDANASESLVAVSNNYTTGSGAGSISLYAHGSTSPTGTLTVPGSPIGVGVALDRTGNCFWSYIAGTSGASYIVEFPKCKGSATPIVTLGQAGGLAFDKAGNLYYTDQSSGSVYKCVGTSDCGVFQKGFTDPFFINFDAGWKHLWLTDPGTATIYGLDPKSGKILSTTAAHGGASDPPFGIAADPGAKF